MNPLSTNSELKHGIHVKNDIFLRLLISWLRKENRQKYMENDESNRATSDSSGTFFKNIFSFKKNVILVSLPRTMIAWMILYVSTNCLNVTW